MDFFIELLLLVISMVQIEAIFQKNPKFSENQIRDWENNGLVKASKVIEGHLRGTFQQCNL